MGIFLQIIGWAGTFLVVLAFILVEKGKISPHSKTYELLNLSGASGIGLNAFSKSDWPSLGLQIIWSSIALFFLIKILREKRKLK